MKRIVAMGAILLSVIIGVTACGRSSYTTEEVTEQAIIDELAALAQVQLAHYFDVEVDQAVEMTASVTRYMPKEGIEGLTERLILLQRQEGDPVEGELYSYQIMIESETNVVKGLYYGRYSTVTPTVYTQEQLQEIGKTFIESKEMIPSGETYTFVKAEKVQGADYIQSLTYQYGDKHLLININTQDGQVMSFEYSA